MKAAGTVSICAAIVFFVLAAWTLYQNTMSVDLAKAQADQAISGESSEPGISNNWGIYSGGEAVLGFVFLIPGIALASRKPQ